MILGCWKRFNKPVAKGLPSNLPTRLGWICLRRIFRKIKRYAIRAEIATFQKDCPNRIYPGYEGTDSYEAYYLNNFHLKIATGRGEREFERHEREGKADVKYRTIYGEKSGRRSKHLLDRTPNQLKGDIDRFVKECGVNVAKIEAWIQESHEQQKPIPLRQIAEKILPVYVRLRAVGYDYADLV